MKLPKNENKVCTYIKTRFIVIKMFVKIYARATNTGYL